MIEIQEVDKESINNFVSDFETMIKEAIELEMNGILQDMEKLVNVLKEYKNN